MKSGIWPADAGASFSWLATLRYTGDYGGDKHVQPEDARTAVEKARLVLRTVRETAPQLLPEDAW